MGLRGKKPQDLSTLKRGWKTAVLDLYKVGGSDSEIKVVLRDYRHTGTFSTKLFMRWLEDEPEFAEVIEEGRLLSQGWWEREGRMNLQNSKFNTGLYIVQMLNRFNWKNRSTPDVEAAKPERDEEFMRTYSSFLRKADTGKVTDPQVLRVAGAA